MPTMNFEKFYKTYKDKISRQLRIYLAAELKAAAKISRENYLFTRTFNEYILRDRSKRLRGLLILLGYRGFGGKNRQEIIKVSAYIELIHNYLLIHDDIIDRDDFRRNGYSLHKQYEVENRDLSPVNKKHLGHSLAIVAGDLCNNIGQEILLEAGFTPEYKTLAQKKASELLKFVIQGEALDVIIQTQKDFDQKTIIQVYKYKTAYYTFAHPVQIGAILAGAGPKSIKNIEKFAIPLGVAFQIQDDMLGLFGDQKTIGKPIGSDLREGKKTLILYFGLEMCSGPDKIFLKKIIGKSDLKAYELEKARKILIECGAVKKCRQLIRKYFETSKKELNNLKLAAEPKKLFIDLIEFIDKRNH
jgi:geranylgeranyl diphosphate synthase, type I